jgi:pimeloyl-ACP methyl ester carboxylesterase
MTSLVPDRLVQLAGLLVAALVVSITGCASPAPPPSASPSSAPSRAAASAPSASPEGSISGSFNVGGRSLFIECRGIGSQTVVFLVGSGWVRTQMRPIEDEVLADGVRVCDYDRAGEGDSDAASAAQTDIDVTNDLAKLLVTARIQPPYVLVGQSVGGDQAWLYANRHPADVAGLLIMNAGFFTLDWDKAKAVWSAEELADEQANAERNLGEVKQAAMPRDGVPYVVMMSTIAQCGSPTDICGRIYPLYEDWARELAGRTPDGRFVSVDAAHEIFDSQPQVVIAEIRRLLADVK